MKTVLPRFVFLFGFLTLVIIGSTQALFSDLEQSIGNILQAAETPDFDLLVNGQNDPEAVVDLDDLKPGDDRIVPKTVRVNGTGDTANIFVHLKDLEASQGAQFEPEIEEENQNGEQSDIQNYLTYDLSIGGNTVIDFLDGLLLPDAVSCWIPLGTIDQNVDVGVEQSFHFDEDVTNWAQGDVLHFTEEFLALSSDAPPPGFPEGSNRVWDEDLKQCVDSNVLWIIGDEEASQTDIPVDELNFVAFGNFPVPPAIGDPYLRTITSPQDDLADEEFPWNSNFNADYGREINIDFTYGGSATNVKLTLGWSPGRSASEQKEVLLDAVSQGTTPVRVGVNTPGWWENMPRFKDEFTFALAPGAHTITLKHLFGDGTLWDFVKLEKI